MNENDTVYVVICDGRVFTVTNTLAKALAHGSGWTVVNTGAGAPTWADTSGRMVITQERVG